MKLSSYAQGRDNNFNLLRLLAAFAVLFSHSFIVAIGKDAVEPLYTSLGVTLGSIAVDIFFVTSGFLVTASLLARKNTVEFVLSRILRIYPALFLMVLISVFVFGVAFTSQPVGVFLHDDVTHLFAIKNVTLIFGVTGNLPGVFESTPYPKVVNASLWTLPFEIRMYGILAIIWLALYLLGRFREKLFASLVVLMAFGALFIHFRDYFLSHEVDNFHRLFFMFFTGASYYVLKEWIVLSHKAFFLTVILVLFSAFYSKDTFFVIYHATVAYITFWVAYVPKGSVRRFNRLGDYSYGVYIYAFPVQQSVAALMPGVTVGTLMMISFVYTFALAFISWHLVEKRALKLKSAGIFLSRRAVSNSLPIRRHL